MFRHTIRSVLTLAALAAAVPASAFIFVGNPHLTLQVIEADIDEGSVFLDKVRVHPCGGGHTDYSVQETIDPVEGYTLEIAGGDICDVTLFWGGVMTLEGEDSNGAFTLEVDDGPTGLNIDGTGSDSVSLPYDQTSGFIFVGNPHLHVDVE